MHVWNGCISLFCATCVQTGGETKTVRSEDGDGTGKDSLGVGLFKQAYA